MHDCTVLALFAYGQWQLAVLKGNPPLQKAATECVEVTIHTFPL
jgi:hypothetical protein